MSKAPWSGALARGGTLLAASASLARRLREDHARSQLGGGLAVWPTPDIIPYDAWLQRSWRMLGRSEDTPLLLSAAQVDALWSRIVAESGLVDRLVRAGDAAVLAARAWQLARSHCLGPADHWFSESEDVRAYRRWEGEFRRRCREHGWTDAASLADQLSERASFAPAPLDLYGFAEPTAQQRRLFAALAERGVAIEHRSPGAAQPRAVRTALPDQAAELRACAGWAARRLAADAEATVGVVIPGLAGRRRQICAVFADAFAAGPSSPGRFGLWQPAALDESPVIAAALAALQLFTPQVRLEQFGVLLASPCFAGQPEERLARAALLDRLRENGEDEFAPGDLRRWLADLASGEGGAGCPRLLSAIDHALRQVEAAPQRNGPSQWSRQFSRLLRTLGWARAWAQDPAEQALLTRWQDLLAEFARLDRVWSQVDARTALARLQRQARAARLQPAALAPPVRIMSPGDADGQRFDALWIAGLDDQSWPPARRPNPFVPLSLQREAGVAEAGSELQHRRYLGLTERLAGAAPEVVFSHAASAGEHVLQPSTLLAAYPAAAAPSDGPGFRERLFAARRLEHLIDAAGSPLAGGHAASGGAGLIRDQAACPFRAYARYRLAARGLEARGIGVEAAERGSAAHRALERLWDALRTQQALLELDEPALSALIERIAERVAVRRLNRGVSDRGAFVQLERERLRAVLQRWLAVERARPPFVVAEREVEREADVAGLRLRLRLDRIDQDPEGRRLLIDYKTGGADPKGWSGDRPDDPQLPLYAVFVVPVDGVMFARLHPEQAELKGWVRAGLAMPGCKTIDDWERQVEDWRRVLTALVEGFRAGDAAVDPKYSRQSCSYCDLPAVCRIAERVPGARHE